MRLEANDIVQRTIRVVTSKLNNGIRLFSGFGIVQSFGFKLAKAQGLLSSARHDLDRHTPLKDIFILKTVHFCFLGRAQFLPEL